MRWVPLAREVKAWWFWGTWVFSWVFTHVLLVFSLGFASFGYFCGFHVVFEWFYMAFVYRALLGGSVVLGDKASFGMVCFREFSPLHLFLGRSFVFSDEMGLGFGWRDPCEWLSDSLVFATKKVKSLGG